MTKLLALASLAVFAVACGGTPPMHLCTIWRPSMYSPSGMPEAAVESVTQNSFGMQRSAVLIAPGCTCSRSGMISA